MPFQIYTLPTLRAGYLLVFKGTVHRNQNYSCVAYELISAGQTYIGTGGNEQPFSPLFSFFFFFLSGAM